MRRRWFGYTKDESYWDITFPGGCIIRNRLDEHGYSIWLWRLLITVDRFPTRITAEWNPI